MMTPSTDENLALIALIRVTIEEAGGYITFAEYMSLALYAPELGYYVNNCEKLGPGGDFVTAPEISPLFSRCLAEQCDRVLQSLGGGDILELGAGTGRMAAEILTELERRQNLPTHYFILELSAELKARQQDTLSRHCPALVDRVRWLDSLPEIPLTGVILANEVVDAMPVHLFRLEGEQAFERVVVWRDGQFAWELVPAQMPALKQALDHIQSLLPAQTLAQGYESEVSLYAPAWIASLQEILARGMLFVIDYGFVEAEYYHPERGEGTLMCHYRHRAHPDPLTLTGQQDITAHVNFSQIAKAGVEAGFSLAGFTTQGHFLVGSGILSQLEQRQDVLQRFAQNQQVKQLLLPHEMGEFFKVLALAKELSIELPSFRLGDWRYRL